MKKLSKKQAEKILKVYFSHIDCDIYHLGPLCISIPFEMKNEWYVYWNKINKSKLISIMQEFDGYSDIKTNQTLITLTRLLTAHMFIEDTYK